MIEHEIRAYIEQQWREAITAEEQAKVVPFNPILLGQRVAAVLAERRDEMEEAIANNIEAARARGAVR